MEDALKGYMDQVISLTFGFSPKVEVKQLSATTYHVVLDGTRAQRQQLMGKDAATFQHLKFMLRVFGRRNQCFTYLYIQPSEDRRHGND